MSAQRPTLRRKKLAVTAVVIGVVWLCGWMAWSRSILGQAPHKLELELKSAKEDGMALDAADLRRQYSAPDDENAAPILLKAFSAFRVWQGRTSQKTLFDNLRKRLRVGPLSADDLEIARSEMPQLRETFLLLEQAAQRPKLDYHRAWERGPALAMPELSETRGCTDALVLKAQCDIAAGKLQDGLDELDTVGRITALIEQEPQIVALLVGEGIQFQVTYVLANVIRDHWRDPLSMTECKTVLADFGPRPSFQHSLANDFVMGRIGISRMGRFGPLMVSGSDSGAQVSNLSRLGAVRNVYELRYVQAYHQLFRALGETSDSVVRTRQVFEAWEQTLNAQEDWSYAFTRLISPSLENIATQVGEAEARRNALICGIELLDAYRKTGVIPTAILGSTGVWVDPFTDRPLLFRATKQGFVVYSVGPDGKDDGGKPRDRLNMAAPYDIPFRYP